MTSVRILLCLIVFHTNFSSIYGQQYPSVHYTTLDGLPNNAIRSLFIDSRGHLWIGTENGVSKMENGTFENFNEDDGLAFNSCWAIEEDAVGNVWFGSYGGGLSKFDGEKFYAYTRNDGLINNKVQKLFSYKDKVYIGTSNGLSIMDIRTNKIVSVEESVSDHTQNYISGFFTHHERIFYTTYGNGTYEILSSDHNPKIKKTHQHSLIYAIGVFDDVLYASNKGLVEKFMLQDFVDQASDPKTFGHSVNWDYVKDNQGNLYTASWGIYTKDGGLYKIEEDRMVDMGHAFGIDSKVILATAFDKSKNILYAGSNDKGLYAVRLDPSILFHSFDERTVIGFEENATQRVILHHSGVSLIDKNTGESYEVTQEQFSIRKNQYVQKNRNSLPKHEDHFFELDFSITAPDIEFYEIHQQKENFWVNTNIGIYEFNRRGKILNYLPIHSYCIGFTPGGRLLESNPYGGVRIFDDVAAMKFTHYSDTKAHTPVQLSKIESTDNSLYFSSVFHGLYKYEKGKFTSLYRENTWNEEKLKRLHHSGEGILVIASEFGDVYVAQSEPSFKILNTISREDIVGNSVLFLESYDGHLLIGTEKGLNIYKDGRIRYVDEEQGLLNRLFTSAKVMGKELYIGTSNGYYIVQLEELLKTRDFNFQLALTAVNINHVPSPKTDFSWFTFKHASMDLPHNQNTLFFEFKPIGHIFPDKLQYRYRLRPGAEWSPYRDETRLDLPYLPYDTYNIEVEVLDRHTGRANIYPLIDFTIHPPVYLRSWFIILLIVLFLMNMWGLYIFRVRLLREREQKKAAIEKRLVETKLEALCSQMNPHFTFNAINSIQYFILKNDTDKALTYLGKFSRLIRNTLDNSSKQRITLQEEIAYLQSYVAIENSRVENRITFRLELDKRIDPKSVYLPPMLIQPFIENVFVHAFDISHPDPLLHLAFHFNEGDVLTCRIKDNGVGINPSRANKFHESKGLKLVKERLQLLPGSLNNALVVNSIPNEGTDVTLRFAIFYEEPKGNLQPG